MLLLLFFKSNIIINMYLMEAFTLKLQLNCIDKYVQLKKNKIFLHYSSNLRVGSLIKKKNCILII